MKRKLESRFKGLLPHEINTAKALECAGYKVVFVQRHNSVRTADAHVNDILFEFKSPEGSKIRTVEHIVKKAAKQSPNLVLDMRRMKRIQERSVQSFLVKLLRDKRIKIKRILFVNRAGGVVDINELV